MKELYSQIEIGASPERVWKILTDFESYPQWNPFIREIRGRPEARERLVVYIQPSGSRGMTFHPMVIKAEANRELRWLGRLLMPGIFDGEHIFLIEELGEGRVRFIQKENFKGMLVPALARSLDRDTKRGFEEMNHSLKDGAEGSGTG